MAEKTQRQPGGNGSAASRPHANLQRRSVKRHQVVMLVAGIALGAVGLTFLAHGWSVDRQPGAVLRRANDGAWFVNVAKERGVTFVHDSGHEQAFYMPEIMSGGAAFLDFDRDGYFDIYFVQAGRVLGAMPETPGNQLFRNLPDGRFVDVTERAGVGDVGYGMGCTCGDFNGDGWTDLYVTNAGPNVLYRNNGDGTFTDVTKEAGVADPGFSASAAFVDYDHDGDLDLFVVNYVRDGITRAVACAAAAGAASYCTPSAYAGPQPDTLYRNNADGTFTNVTRSSGLADRFGNGLGIVCTDINKDGLTDIVVANDLLANQVWVNQGDGTFRDEALERGAAYSGTGVAESGMGVDAIDVDGNGHVDLFMTHFDGQTNTLYLNTGGYFVDRTNAYGLAGSLPYTGFGTAVIDFNNDGLLDIYVANGRVTLGHRQPEVRGSYGEPNQLFEGLHDGTFREVLPRGGTAEPLIHSSRAAAFGDYDNDGDVDIVVVNRDAPAYLLENRAAGHRHWVAFRVLNAHGSYAIGARVEVRLEAKTIVRDVRRAYSYCASNDPRVYIGLAAVSHIQNVRVTWVDGEVEDFGPVGVDRVVDLRRRDRPGPALGGQR